MNKKIISIIFFTIVISSVNAQALLSNKYGLKVGVNISNINSIANEGVSDLEKSALIGLAGGFYMQIPLTDKWSINPELIYAQRGASFNYDYVHDYTINKRDQYIADNSLKLAYVQLNPTVSYKINRLALNVGPSISFLIQEDYSFSEKIEVVQSTSADEILQDPVYESESLDVGLNIGLSYYLTEGIIADATVNTGFMSLGKISKETYTGSIGNDPETNIYDMKNTGVLLSIIYLF